ncbi:MAG: FeoA domain-containing protein [Sedimenticola sp.]|uniref:Ferrous iron transport protein A n=1 Tax=Sedimenticola thiotaurini TaxID=1543721 RepID=A0A558DF02_9GAMM|nr:FeoA domain-containing protein [Sedimenticola sp.]TVT59606.1 MAG: ferrous iron transport protein A [Sedimenticola thiotaurini]MCW8882991.1 FeoA domain-containing protein [Sedimenticola sp.]MCW8921312.1 FeoA domain-containing protein [Sedimenticola sp.]MCW8947299.1 FeoA domain-containing protein [Sedimenticola sp.]
MDTASLDNQITLDHVPAGQHARITKIQGDRSLARRLLGLGLRVGSEISVLQQRNRGVVVATAGTRVALGSSIADKLLMQPLTR